MRMLLFVMTIVVCLVLPGCWDSSQKENSSQEQQKKGPSASINLHDVLDGKSGVDVLREIVSKGNVIVDFYATWCSPCKVMLPVVDEIANEDQNVKVVKVNTDTFRDAADGFQIDETTIKVESVPKFYFFKDGKVVHHFSGAREKAVVQEMIRKYFN